MGMIWAICSGSGGAGKTMMALSLAACSAKQGKKTILLDAAGISRACDLALGLESIVTLSVCDVLAQQIDIQAAMYPVKRYGDLYLVSAALNSEYSCSELSGIILALQSMCDILIVDLPTGELIDGIGVMTRCDSRVFVVRPDDASIRSNEKMMDSVRSQESNRIVILNHVSKEKLKRGLQYGSDAVSATLDCAVSGVIMENDQIAVCEKKGKTAFESDLLTKHAIQSIVSSLMIS